MANNSLSSTATTFTVSFMTALDNVTNIDIDNSTTFNHTTLLHSNDSSANIVEDTSVLLHYINVPYILNIIYYIISSLGIILNIFTILIISLYKPMHKQWTSWFIVNQSTIDTLAATMVLMSTAFPNDLYQRTPGNLADEMLCRIWITQMPMWGFLVSSTYGIVGATFERFLAVVYPLWHKAKFKRKTAFAIIIVSWLVGPVYYIPFAISTSKLTDEGICSIFAFYGSSNLHKLSAIFGFTLSYFAPLIIMAYFYIRMIVVFRRKVSPFTGGTQIHKVQGVGSNSKEHSMIFIKKSVNRADGPMAEIKGKERKSSSSKASQYTVDNSRQELCQQSPDHVKEVTPSGEVMIEEAAPKESANTVRVRHNIIKTLVLVTFGFVLCWSWSEIYFLIFQMGYTHVDFTGGFYNFTVVMVFTSCCINPIIYCVKLRQFQNGIKWAYQCILKVIEKGK